MNLRTASIRFPAVVVPFLGSLFATGLLFSCGSDSSLLGIDGAESAAETYTYCPVSGDRDDLFQRISSSQSCAQEDLQPSEGPVAENVCSERVAGQQLFAVSPDGESVAYLSCADSKVEIVVKSLSGSASNRHSEGDRQSSLEFTLDNTHVISSSEGKLSIVSSENSDANRSLTSATILEYRVFRERVERQFIPRILMMTEQDGQRQIRMYRSDDGYTDPVIAFSDADSASGARLIGDLRNLSDSGRTLIATLDSTAGESYIKLRTNNDDSPFPMSFGPEDYAMGVAGLGDTHNYALAKDRLVRIKLVSDVENLQDKDVVELAAGDLMADRTQLIDREDSPGTKFVHFIQSGNPSRRKREGDGDLEVLAEANATAQSITPDLRRIVYLSDNAVFSVSAIGDGAAVELIEDTGGGMRAFQPVFSADSAQLAYVARRGRLLQVLLDGQGSAVELASEGVDSRSVGYSSGDSHLLWLGGADDDKSELWSVATVQENGSSPNEPAMLADGVSGWMPIAGSSDIMMQQDRQLIRVALP